jgi:hypothetical protein
VPISAECDCNMKLLWIYGFGGLRPEDEIVPQIAKAPESYSESIKLESRKCLLGKEMHTGEGFTSVSFRKLLMRRLGASSTEGANSLSVFLLYPRQSNLILFYLIRMILNAYPQMKIAD